MEGIVIIVSSLPGGSVRNKVRSRSLKYCSGRLFQPKLGSTWEATCHNFGHKYTYFRMANMVSWNDQRLLIVWRRRSLGTYPILPVDARTWSYSSRICQAWKGSEMISGIVEGRVASVFDWWWTFSIGEDRTIMFDVFYSVSSTHISRTQSEGVVIRSQFRRNGMKEFLRTSSHLIGRGIDHNSFHDSHADARKGARARSNRRRSRSSRSRWTKWVGKWNAEGSWTMICS